MRRLTYCVFAISLPSTMVMPPFTDFSRFVKQLPIASISWRVLSTMSMVRLSPPCRARIILACSAEMARDCLRSWSREMHDNLTASADYTSRHFASKKKPTSRACLSAHCRLGNGSRSQNRDGSCVHKVALFANISTVASSGPLNTISFSSRAVSRAFRSTTE